MRMRWLLLAVSVVCVAALVPAAAFSQANGPTIGCGTPDIDGVLSRGEWDNAVLIPMYYQPLVASASSEGMSERQGDVSAENDVTPTGALLLMNDSSHFYLAAFAYFDDVVMNPTCHWESYMGFGWEDEGIIGDGMFDEPDCDPPLPEEGAYYADVVFDGFTETRNLDFYPISEADWCDAMPASGVAWDASLGPMFVREWAVDLTESKMDKVGPGDCFTFGTEWWLEGREVGTDCEAFYGGWLVWPEDLWPEEEPDSWDLICLNPCEAPAEEFVPEPGTIMLLGSGLMGLAGYATLRWRIRE